MKSVEMNSLTRTASCLNIRNGKGNKAAQKAPKSNSFKECTSFKEIHKKPYGTKNRSVDRE